MSIEALIPAYMRARQIQPTPPTPPEPPPAPPPAKSEEEEEEDEVTFTSGSTDFIDLDEWSDCGRCGMRVETAICAVVLTPVKVQEAVPELISVTEEAPAETAEEEEEEEEITTVTLQGASREVETICDRCWAHMAASLDKLKAKMRKSGESEWDLV